MASQAVQLVSSDILHVRHGTPSHRLAKKGLSIWIDLYQLDKADKQAWLFSVNKFNLLCFYEADFGSNHRSFRQKNQKFQLQSLSCYAEEKIKAEFPDAEIETLHLLTFPRILGLAFNPITVYAAYCRKNGSVLMYEVHNTFGDCHTYFAATGNYSTYTQHDADKKMHVSPFYDMQGSYRLGFKIHEDHLRLQVRYSHEGNARLTATLDGTLSSLSSAAILHKLVSNIHFPMRVWFAIHYEAIKLVLKKCRYHRRPEPQTPPLSIAKPRFPEQKG